MLPRRDSHCPEGVIGAQNLILLTVHIGSRSRVIAVQEHEVTGCLSSNLAQNSQALIRENPHLSFPSTFVRRHSAAIRDNHRSMRGKFGSTQPLERGFFGRDYFCNWSKIGARREISNSIKLQLYVRIRFIGG